MAAVDSGSSETGRPFPVLVASRTTAPVLVADHERLMRSSPSLLSLASLTSAHLSPRISPGLRPVRHHTIYRTSSLSPAAALKNRSRPSRLSVVRSFFSTFGASASRATLWRITPFFAARAKATLAVEWTWPTVEGARAFPEGVPFPREISVLTVEVLGGELRELDVPQSGLEVGASTVLVEAPGILGNGSGQGVNPPL
jgi:hypothetical protein